MQHFQTSDIYITWKLELLHLFQIFVSGGVRLLVQRRRPLLPRDQLQSPLNQLILWRYVFYMTS